ncbi:MAG TPA: hypothetical protein VFS00_17570, partial [Polyangiaceae bacterium]|nr:hypothetical protein [Polyangiaceae bacterium]
MNRERYVTLRHVTWLDFRCVHCGHEADVDVVGVGQGGASGLFDRHPFATSERAARRAAKRAAENAMLMARLARCPACGRRDEALLRRTKAAAACKAALATSPCWTLPAALGANKNFPWGLTVGMMAFLSPVVFILGRAAYQ